MNTGDNKSQVFMGADLMRPYNGYKALCETTSLSEIKDALELQKLCNTDKLQFFYKLFHQLEERERESNIGVVGFKITPDQLFFKDRQQDWSILDNIIKYIDRIIVLDRDNIEYMYSHAHAKRTGTYMKREKAERIFLGSDETTLLANNVLKKYYFFENIKTLAAKHRKRCLYLHYNELGNAIDKINRFFEINLTHWCTFQKNTYNYEQFLYDNPGIVTFIKNNPLYFEKNTLHEWLLSTINNEEYEYHI
jgi:hypothetical protein